MIAAAWLSKWFFKSFLDNFNLFLELFLLKLLWIFFAASVEKTSFSKTISTLTNSLIFSANFLIFWHFGFSLKSKEDVAKDIFVAQQKGKDILYTKGIWRFIMLIIKHIPEFIFKKLSIWVRK